MPNTIKAILKRINGLQEEMQQAANEKAAKFRYSYKRRKVIFKAEAIKWQRSFKINLWRYVSGAGILTVLTVPLVYGLLVPFVLLDLAVFAYQAICFPVYGIGKVRRRDYIVIDRQHLAYLNSVQKLNCIYCGYCNGLLALVSEVAARTEAYWCPVKHAGRLAAYHDHYWSFSEYGDAEHFQESQARNIAKVRDETKMD